jgi:hypothetical protein
MDWLNLHTSTLDSEQMVDATPHQRGVWMFLTRYCIGQETGGRLEGAKNWDAKKWLLTGKVDKTDVQNDCGLWQWDGDDLVVALYPIEKERQVVAGRTGGSKGGRPKKPAKEPSEKPLFKPSEKPLFKPSAEPSGKPEGNGTEEERKRTETEKEGEHDAPGKVFSEPKLEDVIAYGERSGVSRECCSKFFHENKAAGWIDRRGRKMVDWQSGLMAYGVAWRSTEAEYKNRRGPDGGNHPEMKPGDRPAWWRWTIAELRDEAIALAQSSEPKNKTAAQRVGEIIAIRERGQS